MEEALKIVGALASLFAVYKIVVDVVLARSTRRRDEYKFTKEYITDLRKGEEHLYTLEKGFFALTGKMYSIPEVNVLLSQRSPSISLNLRGDSGSFVLFDEESNKYIWKGKYSKKFIRKYAGKWFFSWYVITASLAILPVYTKGTSVLASFPVTAFSASLFVVAVSCLIQQSNLSNAKKFMESIVYSEPNNLSQQDAASGTAA